jgi:hypothetical protein
VGLGTVLQHEHLADEVSDYRVTPGNFFESFSCAFSLNS